MKPSYKIGSSSGVVGVSRVKATERVAFYGCRLFMLIWSVMVIFPLLWGVYSSFKNNREFYANPWALPSKLHFENYYNAWVVSHMANYFLNSLIMVVFPLLLSLFMASTTAYIIAKYNFWGRQALEYIYISSMMIPVILTLIPLFFLAQALHMANSIIGLIVIYAVTVVPFSVCLLIGFFKTIPDSLAEAATMDGCSDYSIFFRIILPLSKNGLITVGIINAMSFWNEYIIALTFLTDEKKYTVPIGISFLSASMEYRTDFGALFAGLVIAMIPIVSLYVIFQRQLQEGMSAGTSIKG